MCAFFFSSRRRHTRSLCDWSSDVCSSDLPFFKRIKLFHITPFELPRTATRKVKRPEVVEMLQAMEERAKTKTKAVVESKGDDNTLWIRKVVASVSNRPLSDVVIEDKLADLGFDSLM